VSQNGELPVVVVGAGIAGAACARAVRRAGLRVRVLDRGRRVGGRMALREEVVGGNTRVVDIGASYFTVSDRAFAALAEGWRERGLAREWTDTFAVVDRGGGDPCASSGPVRWAAPSGLRSLVEDLLEGLDVASDREVEQVDAERDTLAVDGEPVAAVALAMPQPQAIDLLPTPLAGRLGLEAGTEWSPTLTVWAAWPQRWWPPMDGAFVAGSDVVERIADDGRRRGDDAPVLVVHSTHDFADRYLDDPEAGVQPVLAEVAELLGAPGRRLPAPAFAKVRRWALAAPSMTQDRPFALDEQLPVGVCGDAWGPRSRVEQAWLSGNALGEALARRLG
jgi:renalase